MSRYHWKRLNYNMINIRGNIIIIIRIIIIIIIYYFYSISHNESECIVRSTNKESEPLIIAVLGGGAQGVINENSLPPKHTILRLDLALKLCRQDDDNDDNENSSSSSSSSRQGLKWKPNCIIIPLSKGTTHKPPPQDTLKYPISECGLSARYLLKNGFPSSQIREEDTSLDTVGNAYFLRAVHILPMSYRQNEKINLVIITNDWHMPRTRAIFDTVFHLPIDDINVQNNNHPNNCLHMTYLSAESGLSREDHISRVERETKSLTEWISISTGPSAKFKTFRELYTWLFTIHNAYAVSRFEKNRDTLFEVLDEKTLKSY